MSGYRGYQKCACAFDVWGFSSNAPAWRGTNYYATGNAIYGEVDNPVALGNWPDVGDAPTVWMVSAAKVPSCYPYQSCDKFPPSSSADARIPEVDRFAVPIATAFTEEEKTVLDVTQITRNNNVHYVHGSRVTYVDGEQRYVTYRITADSDEPGSSGDPDGLNNRGDFVQVDIAAKEVRGKYYMDYPRLYSGDPTAMEELFTTSVPSEISYGPTSAITGTELETAQHSAQNECFGMDYYVSTSYVPGATAWKVARAKYATGARMEIWCSQKDVGTSNELGYAVMLPSCRTYIDSSVHDPEGEYGPDECWVVAKETREGYPPKLVTGRLLNKDLRTGSGDEETGYWDGSLLESEVENVILDGSDPEWADATGLHVRCYQHKDGKDLVLFTTNGEPETATPLADFEIADDVEMTTGTAVEAGGANTIKLESTADNHDDFYNGMQIEITGGTGSGQTRTITDYDGDDRLVTVDTNWSTNPDTDSVYVITDLSDGYDPHYIDHGLPRGLSFTNGGSLEGNEWLADAVNPYDGSYSARTNINALFAGTCTLSIQVNVLTESTLTFRYIHNNRKYGSREEPWTSLTTFPEPDNDLRVTVDDALVPITIDGTLYELEDGGSKIDNVNVPNDNPNNDADWYTTWREASITLKPGTHRIKWTLTRVWQDNGWLYSQLDNIQFPELMLGNDITGAKRWYYDGEQVRPAGDWKWAARDDENETPIASRTATTPDYITSDHEDRIYIGNPHYVVCLLPETRLLDKSFGAGGVITFTASPNNQEFRPTGPTAIDDPCYLNPQESDDLTTVDTIEDPGWGDFQILPTRYGLQVRGANGTMRDATTDGIVKRNYPGEKWAYIINPSVVRHWNWRINGFTIRDHGKTRIPHVEALWRFDFDITAWPDKAPYNSPPYPWWFNFACSYLVDNGLPGGFIADWNGVQRWRSSQTKEGSAGDRQARWNDRNTILSRVYGDTYSRPDQYAWLRPSARDPVEADGDLYYQHPWPSVRWQPAGAYHCPSASHGVTFESPTYDRIVIPDVCEAPSDFYHQGRPQFTGLGPFTDFDAVDCNCPCGCIENVKQTIT